MAFLANRTIGDVPLSAGSLLEKKSDAILKWCPYRLSLSLFGTYSRYSSQRKVDATNARARARAYIHTWMRASHVEAPTGHRYSAGTLARDLAVLHVGKCVKDVRTGLQNGGFVRNAPSASLFSLFLLPRRSNAFLTLPLPLSARHRRAADFCEISIARERPQTREMGQPGRPSFFRKRARRSRIYSSNVRRAAPGLGSVPESSLPGVSLLHLSDREGRGRIRRISRNPWDMWVRRIRGFRVRAQQRHAKCATIERR